MSFPSFLQGKQHYHSDALQMSYIRVSLITWSLSLCLLRRQRREKGVVLLQEVTQSAAEDTH